MSRRITIFVGAYGSGKTEIALNTVERIAPEHPHIAIVDLDIMKPYFRSREHKVRLIESKIDVIAPSGAMAAADLPALPAEIYSVLQNPEIRVIMDVGGDDAGAVALGRFRQYFTEGDYDLFLVINTHRPFTKRVEDTVTLARRIEARSRIKITGVVSNSNLGSETTAADVVGGYQMAKDVAEAMGVPLTMVVASLPLVPEVSERLPGVPVMPLHRRVLPPWERLE